MRKRKLTVPLNTSRLLLRRWAWSDARQMFAYSQDPEVGLNAGWKPHVSIWDARRAARDNRRAGLIWAICRQEDGLVMGSIGLYSDAHRVIKDKDGMELGFSLGKSYWGQGLMTEASQAVLEYAFRVLNLGQVSIYHFPANERCRRLVQKLGFCYERTIPRATLMYDGTTRDCLSYVMSRELYKQKWGC